MSVRWAACRAVVPVVAALALVAACGSADGPAAGPAPVVTVDPDPPPARRAPPTPTATAPSEPDPTSTPEGTAAPGQASGASTGSSGRAGSSGATAGGWWRPAPGVAWQWQLSGRVDLGVPAEVFDVDGEGTDAATVAALHAAGAHAVCYIDAGAWESYRGDARAFPDRVLGNAVHGWPEERWLDVRALDVLLPIMAARIADCAAKGFDAVEADLVEGYTEDTGFPLTAADQVAYDLALADLAHEAGLGIALKNAPGLVAQLEPAFDFAVVEECAAYDECEAYLPFVRAGKAVLHVEYSGSLESFCPETTALGFSSMLKRVSLDAWRRPCP